MLSFDFAGTLHGVSLRPDRFAATLGAVLHDGRLILHRTTPDPPLHASLGGQPIRAVTVAGGFAFDIAQTAAGHRLDVVF